MNFFLKKKLKKWFVFYHQSNHVRHYDWQSKRLLRYIDIDRDRVEQKQKYWQPKCRINSGKSMVGQKFEKKKENSFKCSLPVIASSYFKKFLLGKTERTIIKQFGIEIEND
jgi:hypothetical protein